MTIFRNIADRSSRTPKRAAALRVPRLESLEQRQLLAGDGIGGDALIFAGGSAEGTKWEDLNGDGIRQDNEPGLSGVTIYADLNNNGRLDRHEPLTSTRRDDPNTAEDEGGRYALCTMCIGVGQGIALVIERV